MHKAPAVLRQHDCPIDPEYTAAIRDLTRSVGTAVLKKLQDARTQEGRPATSANRGPSDVGLVDKDKYVRQLEVAVQFPGFLSASRNARMHLDDITATCSRLPKLESICNEAYEDKQSHPDDGECRSGFSGPKNVVVFVKWPILAYLLPLWFEKNMDCRCFQPALMYRGIVSIERQDMMQ
ncbi:hypothetical protein CMEL01_16747 [Colletotrichum melonis]|uniref:Uncharacterized protein n=1 Tax=Colletotrichum melonis TaxID=1209925 RepID=A0AAI9U8X4_9PEZI|nr:hypothetical protein CMEL01_16747 [Colletotrichum melonis]